MYTPCSLPVDVDAETECEAGTKTFLHPEEHGELVPCETEVDSTVDTSEDPDGTPLSGGGVFTMLLI